MKRILLLFLLLLLLVSCSRDTKAIALVSSSGIEAHAYSRKGTTTVFVSASQMASLSESLDMTPEEIAEVAFEGFELTTVDGDAFLRRGVLYRALEKFTGEEGRLEVLKKNGKELEASSFFQSVDTLAPGFDKTLRTMAERKGTCSIYDAEESLGENFKGEEDLIFLKLWIKAIIS